MTLLAYVEGFYFSTNSSLGRHYYHNIVTIFAGKIWHTTSCLALVWIYLFYLDTRFSMLTMRHLFICPSFARLNYSHMQPYIEASQRHGSQSEFHLFYFDTRTR
jgi:hypothetical protein